MITIPTVLVLGAGASYPYGFPTAKELRILICEAFTNPNTPASRLLGEASGHSPDGFFRFREAFLKSGQPSVDAFLEWRPDFLAIGKLAIAYCLLPFEDESKLFTPPGNRGGDWYQYLSVKLNASFEDFGSNKLSIITFNYDRSLELIFTLPSKTCTTEVGMIAMQLSRRFRSFTFTDSWVEAHIQIPQLSHMARGRRSSTRTLIRPPRG